jgi:hypothetical protein
MAVGLTAFAYPTADLSLSYQLGKEYQAPTKPGTGEQALHVKQRQERRKRLSLTERFFRRDVMLYLEVDDDMLEAAEVQ